MRRFVALTNTPTRDFRVVSNRPMTQGTRAHQLAMVGAMTNGTRRSLTVDLSFPGARSYAVAATADGIDGDRKAVDYRRERRTLTSGDTLMVQLAPGERANDNVRGSCSSTA